MTENRGDLISRSELKKYAISCQIHNGTLTDLCVPLYQINNAPTVVLERPKSEDKQMGIKKQKHSAEYERGYRCGHSPLNFALIFPLAVISAYTAARRDS